MNYLATFSKLYRKYAGEGLPSFKPAQYQQYNAKVKAIFLNCFKAGMDWELYLEYVFNLNPLSFQSLKSYNSVDRLVLALPHYYNFIQMHQASISQIGLLATIRSSSTTTISHAISAPTFSQQLAAYNERMAGSVGVSETAEQSA